MLFNKQERNHVCLLLTKDVRRRILDNQDYLVKVEVFVLSYIYVC